jgi:hypothetical protein
MLKRKKNYKLLIGFIIGMLISATGVYAVSYFGPSSNLTYDNSKSVLTSTNVQDALDELYYAKNHPDAKCPYGYSCTANISLGSYVSYTSTSTSYTTDKSKTGYSSTQTIDPSELNLWRVLNLNDDGSVDLISEYTSSVAIYFQGSTGYKNYVGYLNELSSQYENSDYTQESRYFGYDGQTEFLTTVTKFTCSTGGSCNPVESEGGGDTLYKNDYDQALTALGTLSAYRVGTTSVASYFVASRRYGYVSSSSYYYLYIRYINSSGSLTSAYVYYYGDAYSFNSYLRPIVTLKSFLTYTGEGTAESPYTIVS